MSRHNGTLCLGIGLTLAFALTFSASTSDAQSLCGEWAPVEPPPGLQTITDVTASSTSQAWALSGEGATVHWDGSTWTEFPLPPNLDNLGMAVSLRATTSLAPSRFFVAGILQTGVWTSEQLLLSWNGSEWEHVESLELVPGVGGAPRYGSPSAIAAVAPDDLWIIGLATGSGDGTSGSPILTLHWDGTELTEHFTPGVGNRQNNMYDAVAIASDDMWAVGEYNNTGTGNSYFHGMTYHYDGSTWNNVENPTQGIDSSHLNAVAAIATDDVWAAGDSPDGPLFIHWDGNSWSVVPGPPGASGTIYGLAAIATDDVWAVDFPGQLPIFGKYYHWDGTEWSVVEPEIEGATRVVRHGGLAAVGECDVWAVGNVDYGSGVEAFIERLGGASTSGVSTVSESVASFDIFPNPMSYSVEISFTGQDNVPHRGWIYNVEGQRVRTLFGAPLSGSVVTWNGRDDRGEPVPGGVYFLRVESREGRAATKHLTVAR